MSQRGFACIGLSDAKDGKNIGGALRAAGCYGARMVAVSGGRYKGNPTDTQKAWKHIPLLTVVDLRHAIPAGAVCVAVDLIDGATPLMRFTHPERAFYIFGGEDRTLGADVLQWCDHRVFVPTAFCMNLAATVNVVLYDRLSKLKEPKEAR